MPEKNVTRVARLRHDFDLRVQRLSRLQRRNACSSAKAGDQLLDLRMLEAPARHWQPAPIEVRPHVVVGLQRDVAGAGLEQTADARLDGCDKAKAGLEVDLRRLPRRELIRGHWTRGLHFSVFSTKSVGTVIRMMVLPTIRVFGSSRITTSVDDTITGAETMPAE